MIDLHQAFLLPDKTFRLSLEEGNFSIVLEYCDDRDAYYRTYGAHFKDEQRKIYFIELKKHKESGRYNFKNFKDKASSQDVLFINFKYPPETQEFILPSHMMCYVIRQDGNFIIEGNYHEFVEIIDITQDERISIKRKAETENEVIVKQQKLEEKDDGLSHEIDELANEIEDGEMELIDEHRTALSSNETSLVDFVLRAWCGKNALPYDNDIVIDDFFYKCRQTAHCNNYHSDIHILSKILFALSRNSTFYREKDIDWEMFTEHFSRCFAYVLIKVEDGDQREIETYAKNLWWIFKNINRCAIHEKPYIYLNKISPDLFSNAINLVLKFNKVNQYYSDFVFEIGWSTRHKKYGLMNAISEDQIYNLINAFLLQDYSNSRQYGRMLRGIDYMIQYFKHEIHPGKFAYLNVEIITALINGYIYADEMDEMSISGVIQCLRDIIIHEQAYLLDGLKSEQIALLVDTFLLYNRYASHTVDMVIIIGFSAEKSLLSQINETHIITLINVILSDFPHLSPISSRELLFRTIQCLKELAMNHETRHLLKGITPLQFAKIIERSLCEEKSNIKYIASFFMLMSWLPSSCFGRQLLTGLKEEHVAQFVEKFVLSTGINAKHSLWAFRALSFLISYGEASFLVKKINPKYISTLLFFITQDESVKKSSLFYYFLLFINNKKTCHLLDEVSESQFVIAFKTCMGGKEVKNIQIPDFIAWLCKRVELEKINDVHKTMWKELIDNNPTINRYFAVNLKIDHRLIVFGDNSSLSHLNKIFIKFKATENLVDLMVCGLISYSPSKITEALNCIKEFLRYRIIFSRFSLVVDLLLKIHTLDQGNEKLKALLLIAKNYANDYPKILRKPILEKINPLIAIEDIANVENVQHQDNQALTKHARKSCELLPCSEDRILISEKNVDESYPLYDIKNSADIEKLMAAQPKDHAFFYDKEFNKKRTPYHLSIQRVAILSLDKENLGVFANEHIQSSDRTIGCYAGEIVTLEDENEHSHYIFQIVNKHGEITHSIDGEKRRDWTGFVNHSPTPNMIVQQKNDQIYFYVVTDIAPGDQLFINYGEDTYFKKLGYQPYYCHPKDGSESAATNYLKNKDYYEAETYRFDEDTMRDLQLTTPSLLIPKIFISIYQNNPHALEAELSSAYPLDLLSFSCENNQIAPTKKQQHITPLMLACYLGHEDCIKLLLQQGADANRLMLVAGLSPLSLLLLGRGDLETIERVGKMLLDKKYSPYPFVADINQLTILHYAIIRNSAHLVREILDIAIQDKHNPFDIMFNRDREYAKHADFSYCILHGQFDVLKIMLDAIAHHPSLSNRADMDDNYVDYICKEETLLQTSLEHLLTLKDLLRQEKYDDLLGSSDCLSRLDRCIEGKKENVSYDSAQTTRFFYHTPRQEAASSSLNLPLNQFLPQ